MVENKDILAVLTAKRPVFHSEADFQHAFAWEIHRGVPDASVRLEFPFQFNGRPLHIDIWAVHQGKVVAVELKYKTRDLAVRIGGEQFSLKSQSAQDLGRYDFLKDIQRLEQVATAQREFTGYAVLLTNDSAYWLKPANKTVDADFRLYDGRILAGTLGWGAGASDGTKKDREQPLVLRNKYLLHWTDYSQPSAANYGVFRSLVVKVT